MADGFGKSRAQLEFAALEAMSRRYPRGAAVESSGSRDSDTGRAMQNAIPHNSDRGAKQMQQVKKRGAPPGNYNALKSGKYSPRKRAERRAARLPQIEAKRQREAEWAAKCPSVDYKKLSDELAAYLARRDSQVH